MKSLKEMKYLLLDLDGVCYGSHNGYPLEKVFGLVSKRMTLFIQEKLGLDEKIPPCHNRLLPLPNQCNKLVTWVQVELERETAIGPDAGQERRRKIAGCNIAAFEG